MDGLPFGWGKRFNENGDLMYEGFSIFDRYCLYGTDYYPDLHTARYEGNWCNGERCGKGVLYNRRGEKVDEGEWMSDSQVIDPTVGVENTPLLPVLTSLLEILIIGENCCNECDCLLLNDYPRLKGLHIGSKSFGKESEEEMLFSCVNCPELIILQLSECVMQHYKRMLIQDNPKLQKLNLGSKCFVLITDVRIERNASLEIINIGHASLNYDMAHHGPTERRGELYLTDLPNLGLLGVGFASCMKMRKMVVKGIPRHVVCHFENAAFLYVADIQSKGCADLHKSIQHFTPFMSLGKDPLPKSSSLIMEERSELRAQEVLSRLAEDNADYEEIIINDNNLSIAGDFVVNNMLLLRTLIVKNRCFYGGVDVSREDNIFAVINAPSLKVIDIGDSFCCFNTFRLSNCDALEELSIGGGENGAFRYVPELSLSNLPSLQRIVIKRNSFNHTKIVSFEYLPALKTIDLEENTFCDKEDSEGSLPYCPFKYNVSLVMKSNLFMPS
ncbi:hypothetical protein BLSTO_05240 [Blastocystis sp. subtype 1]